MNVYPTLAGLTWPITRNVIMTAVGGESVSGRYVGGTYFQYPLFEFNLTYAWFEPGDMDQLLGLFLESAGGAPFLFDAGPGDDSVDQASFGAGDGATKTFPLLRSIGGFVLPVDATFGARTAYVAGAAASATFDSPSPGEVTFAAAPASGAALTWTGNYYYKVRFKNDHLSADEFLSQLHQGNVVLRTHR